MKNLNLKLLNLSNKILNEVKKGELPTNFDLENWNRLFQISKSRLKESAEISNLYQINQEIQSALEKMKSDIWLELQRLKKDRILNDKFDLRKTF